MRGRLVEIVRRVLGVCGRLLIPLANRNSPRIDAAKRVLVLLWGGIGNAVLFSPALTALREKYRESHMVLFSLHPSAPQIFQGLADEVVTVGETGFRGFSAKLNLVRSLRRVRPDLTISNAVSPCFITSLLAFLSGAKVRAGSDVSGRGFLNTIPLPQRQDLHEVERNLEFVRPLGVRGGGSLSVFISPEDRESARRTLSELGVERGDVLVGLQPGSGAGQSFKRWDEERFSQLCDLLVQQPRVKALVFKGPDEREVVDRILSRVDRKERILDSGETPTLSEAAALVEQCSLFVSNDTGLMHIAAACGVPIVAIFGPTHWLKNEPWRVPHRIVRARLDCSPCYNYHVPCCAHLSCLKSIEVDMVLQACLEMLEGSEGGRAVGERNPKSPPASGPAYRPGRRMTKSEPPARGDA